ncbi:MAG: hypothetical protein ACP5UZ_01825 [Thermoplasmata archaeon]
MEPVRIPITDQLHRNRRRVVIVSVVVSIITISVFLGLSLNTVGTVNVMGVQVHIDYMGTSQGYFGSTIQNYTWNVKTLYAGEIFHFSLPIYNSANSTMTIGSVSLSTSGFTLLGSSESVPLQIGAHSSHTIVLTIKSPNYGYVGTVDINILAT